MTNWATDGHFIKNVNNLLLTAYCALFTIVQAGSASASNTTPMPWRIAHPMSTQSGIIFTDVTGSSLYLTHDGTMQELLSAPGCGRYFALSPDRSTIGFKEILDDGTQAPALLHISTKKVTLLHSPVPQCGQVSFDAKGDIAYSIGEDVFIQSGRQSIQIPIGTYSNIVALSPEGGKIAYVDDHGYVYIIDVRTRQRLRISSAGCMLPLWAPVGTKLCYSSLNGKLFVFDSQDAKTYSLGGGADPAWTTDATSLIVVRREIQDDTLVNSDLYKISFDGKGPIRLTETKDIFETDPSVGADNAVVFASYNDDRLYTARLDGGLKINSTIRVQPSGIQQEEKSGSTAVHRVESPTATPFFEVPYVNQVWDTPYGFGSVGESACAPTSSIMVIAYYNLLPPWNVQLAIPTKHVNAWGNYVLVPYHFHGVYFQMGSSGAGGGYGYMWNSSDPYHMMASYYNCHGLNASELDAPSLDTVISEVSSGHPYTLCNGLTSAGHVIVINGIGSQRGTIIANDPYGNANSSSWPNYYGKDVQYDWPGYNNGNQNLNEAWWGVSVRCASPAVPDSIVDDLQFNDGFILNNAKPASMSLWLDRNSGYNGHFWYTYTRQSDTCTAEWQQPESLQSGEYEVLAYVPTGTARAARYRIYYHGGSAIVLLDQSQYTNSWASLGIYPFVRGDSGYVKLGDGSDDVGQILEFDAMAWSYQGPLLVQSSSAIPTQMSLDQNYPNPFNPTTAISYQVSAVSHVVLKVYDVLGRGIATLVDEVKPPGKYEVRFDGSRLASGIYFYRLITSSRFVQVKKMILKK